MNTNKINQALESIDEILNSTINCNESLEYELTSFDLYWLETAREAVEKQALKKPLTIKYDEDVHLGAITWRAGVPVYKCPICESFLNSSCNFCPKCGQKIDWSKPHSKKDEDVNDDKSKSFMMNRFMKVN